MIAVTNDMARWRGDIRVGARPRKRLTKRVVAVAALAMATLVITTTRVYAQGAVQYDVLIRGGHVLDGTGNPWRNADVAIRGDRIVAIAPSLPAANAKQVVDATGQIVTPGFIDGHSHAAPGIGTEELAAAKPLLTQGITAVLLNPDGGGPADLKTQIDPIQKWTPGVNVFPTIGHNAVRAAVMGLVNRAPTPAEQKQMEELVRKAMELGAFGFSSGPYYIPGKFSETSELVGLAKVAAKYPGAFHTSHIRDEATYNIGWLAAVDELISVSRQAKLPGIVTHIKGVGPTSWGKSVQVVEKINAARAEGLEIWADHYVYTTSGGSLQAVLVPAWAQEGGAEALAKRLQDPEQRKTIRKELADNMARRAGAGALMITNYKPDPKRNGKRLDAIARERGEDPLDTAIDMMIAGGSPVMSFSQNDKDVDLLVQQPWVITSTDGSLQPFGVGVIHPRAYGGFPRKIRRYVIDRKIITMEHAIRSSSGLPAMVYGLEDRGVLRAGAYADVVVFDPKTIEDTATYEKPHSYSKGINFVFVNGQPALMNGEVTAKRSGRVLLKKRPT
jgi:N-acyl-D-amino-acid deacylase